MYFCVDKYGKSAMGKTIVDSYDIYEEDYGDFSFSDLKFYKAEEIKVELVATTVVKKVPVAVKKPMSKK